MSCLTPQSHFICCPQKYIACFSIELPWLSDQLIEELFKVLPLCFFFLLYLFLNFMYVYYICIISPSSPFNPSPQETLLQCFIMSQPEENRNLKMCSCHVQWMLFSMEKTSLLPCQQLKSGPALRMPQCELELGLHIASYSACHLDLPAVFRHCLVVLQSIIPVVFKIRYLTMG